MANLDPRIEAIRAKYDLGKDDFWELPQKKGTWLAKHSALEAAAAKAGIMFDPPTVIESNSAEKIVALCVSGGLSDRQEWSIGEASPANNKNAYPYAMAEKRGKDRVILKLLGLHGLVYSEEEMDNASNGNGSKPSAAATQDPDVTDGVANWVATQKAAIAKAASLPALYEWLEKIAGSGATITDPGTGSVLDRLKRKSPDAYGIVVSAWNARLMEINRKEKQ